MSEKYNFKTRIHRRIMIHYDENIKDVTLELALQRIVCFISGHTPVRDQCMKPEHDYCLWCTKSMPYKWKKS